MIPHVLISSSEMEIQLFLDRYIAEHNIPHTHVFNILPETTEFSVNQIREIKKHVMLYTPESRLFILRDFHKSSFEAQNAFLKTLEEHMENIHFILSTVNQHRLLPTIKSRAKIITLPIKSVVGDPEVIDALTAFIEKGDNSIFQLVSLKAAGETVKTTQDVVKQFIYFFKNRLATDIHASKTLSEIINASYILENNHIDSQLTIDHILFSIKKHYSL